MMRKMFWMAAPVAFALGCGGASSDGANSDSEVATSVVSGALNNSGGSMLGMNDVPREHRSVFERIVDQVRPIATAFAATWTCTGGDVTPAFDGAAGNPYAYTPVSCSVTWGNGRTASSKWSSTFGLDYGAQCDDKHAWIGNQVADCSVTRTTAAGGNTRSLTGPDGNSYSITHDTNGAGSGWDSSVTPAPTNDGLVATCSDSGCASGTLTINGSHLTGTVALAGGAPSTIWNHTVSTGAGGLSVTGADTRRVVNGSVTVQHNILKYTATASFNNVGYGEAGCCFPTTGSVTTTFHNGADKNKSESLAFSAICGEATLTTAAGNVVPITLQHCL